MHADREHVISVVLNHDDWKEFVKLQPQPVNWLRERIQEMIASQAGAGTHTPIVAGPAPMASSGIRGSSVCWPGARH